MLALCKADRGDLAFTFATAPCAVAPYQPGQDYEQNWLPSFPHAPGA